MSDGRASRATLEALWRLLLEDLVAKLQAPKKAAVDLLQVARKFLRDNACGPPDAQARKDLEVLYRMYSKALHEALSRPERPAGVLAEARHWLQYHGIRPDIPAAQAASVAKKLSELDVPFPNRAPSDRAAKFWLGHAVLKLAPRPVGMSARANLTGGKGYPKRAHWRALEDIGTYLQKSLAVLLVNVHHSIQTEAEAAQQVVNDLRAPFLPSTTAIHKATTSTPVAPE